MGIDVQLLPFSYNSSFSVLALSRRSDLIQELSDINDKQGIDVPRDFYSYVSRDSSDGCEESHFGKTIEDSYGNRVKWVHCSDLLALSKHPGVQDNRENRAVWAYLKELEPQAQVALFFH